MVTPNDAVPPAARADADAETTAATAAATAGGILSGTVDPVTRDAVTGHPVTDDRDSEHPAEHGRASAASPDPVEADAATPAPAPPVARTAAGSPAPTTAGTPAAPTLPAQPFTHLNSTGQARMVDVTEKKPTVRSATATGFVTCGPLVIAALRDGSTPKGDVLAVARIAGIQGAKKTADLLPLAHVIGVHGASVDLEVTDTGVSITATVRTADRTGVEMEAFTAVTVAALAIVDMVKGLDKSVTIDAVRLLEKTGGKSGAWHRV